MSIEVQNIKKSFLQSGHRIDVLKGASFSIKDKEIVALLGHSGSGKSTLLSLLSGLDAIESGRIQIGGTELSGLNEKATTAFRGQNIGIIFQQFHLLSHLTALENVMVPLEIAQMANAESLAEKMLKAVGLGERINHIPAQLSGGECQRVAIARALVVKPKLLLADEPSGNLDVETGRSVMDLLIKTIREAGTTTLLVTHNEELANLCDRKLRLSLGVVTPC